AIPCIGHDQITAEAMIVDGRPQEQFKAGHHQGAINIPDGTKFETWLGSVIAPDESFYLIAADQEALTAMLEKAAKIGYERNISGAILANGGPIASTAFEIGLFKRDPQNYTIVDIRNQSETTAESSFERAVHIPLHELRERI